MSTQVQRRRGTTAQNDAFTGAVGEFTYDTEQKRIRAHDGVLAGGFPHALKAEIDAAQNSFIDYYDLNGLADVPAAPAVVLFDPGGGGFPFEVIIPSSGTYLILAQVGFQANVAAWFSAFLHNATLAVNVGSFAVLQIGALGLEAGSVLLSAVTVANANDQIQVWAYNVNGAFGFVDNVTSNITAVKLY